MGRKMISRVWTVVGICLVAIIAMKILIPAYISIKNGPGATLTIVSDVKPPFSFVLVSNDSKTNGPLVLHSKIVTHAGKGSFVQGDYENMDYYGAPAFYSTRFSRKIVLEIVDKDGNLISREESRLGNVVYLGFEDDSRALNGKRFFVRR